MKRIRAAVCRLVGHRPPEWFSGYYRGRYVRAEGCPRCKAVIGRREIGSRQMRRAARRAS